MKNLIFAVAVIAGGAIYAAPHAMEVIEQTASVLKSYCCNEDNYAAINLKNDFWGERWEFFEEVQDVCTGTRIVVTYRMGHGRREKCREFDC